MKLDQWVLAVSWAFSLSVLLFAVPRDRRREGLIILFFTQMITWSLSLLFVELGMITNPVREFPRATRANFTFNFVLYPAVSVLSGIYYPEQGSRFTQLLYQTVVIASLSLGMELVAAYTDLIKHVRFNGFIASLVLLFVLNASRIYAQWFFGRVRDKGA